MPSIGAVQLTLFAVPDRLASAALAAGASGPFTTDPRIGTVHLEFKNPSVVPVELTVTRLSSLYSHVATATSTAVAQIKVPPRPNLYSSKLPSVGQAVVGTWTPVSTGSAGLQCHIEGSSAGLPLLRPQVVLQTQVDVT